ncbi:MAG: NAD(P)-dependent oxidoreductase [SAR324 cluster bacterium]|nr:NAD(P)-dependent oxidoreductase [SAR324 cluster bacterium]
MPKLKRHQINQAQQSAFELNQNLPESYQVEIFNEAIRFYKRHPDVHQRKVLLIGGGGYIGSVLTGYLLGGGYQVRTLDLLIYQNQQAILPYLSNPDYEFMHGDLCDSDTVERSLIGITDVVILAGLVGDPITKKYPLASDKINSAGIQKLIDQLNGKNLNRVILISTCSNYGLIPENALADEHYELTPLSLYAKAKVAAEQHLLSLQGKVDYCPVIFRFATAFGLSPRMRFDLSVSEFVRELYLKHDLLVYDCDTWRPYCHTKDFSLIIRRALEAPQERVAFQVFNAGGEANNYTKKMIINEILKYIPEGKVSYKEQGSDPRNYRVNFQKIKKALYFEPIYTVGDGVQEVISALNQHLFDQVESNRNYYGNYEIQYE